MTLALAIADWTQEKPAVCIAADGRLSSDRSAISDEFLKTLELGGRAGVVISGNALPALTAAEATRPLVENHNRSNPTRMGFYDTVRLFAFFLRRAAEKPGFKCRTAVVGFLQSGAPCIASVEVSPDKNVVRFHDVDRGSFVAIPIGTPEATKTMIQGLSEARAQGRSVFRSGISLLWYMSKHEGAFATVGGGPSLGGCGVDENFSWCHVEIEGRRFLRGLEVSAYVDPSWGPPLVVDYDESWCSTIDQRVATEELNRAPTPREIAAWDIDQLSAASVLFKTHDDPLRFGDVQTPNSEEHTKVPNKAS